ncbi:probable ATP-dependent (S)-NAD(P)H-hydrate dehydratase [Melanopsichium pennsylvanicum]|uniref:ATP-dependent (S)-NAD(P)H-hydrate dehydratase n=2 Tax=Melanopsichium pennsylvanicum TaxID=63383 RepID=A0AAJ4XKM2_9BASI|nr:domain-containing protein [Melanopsichium pennsylvanicum 4]SNX83706.1 probable ATP-dependent (S)-NAD(P)H-hydrate dehydratase [Melanopsichium pennsylvanicum]
MSSPAIPAAKLASSVTTNLSNLASRTLASAPAINPICPTQVSLMNSVKCIIPALSNQLHKGQAGRIGIVGGSKDYTGAPFFASMSSMRFGCDMSYTICTPEAGSVIKTYSPDLIVNRLLDPEEEWETVEKNVGELFERFHAVVIGPGLGRDEFMQRCAKLCINLAKKNSMYLVIDADGLWLLQNEPDLIKGYRRAILTPNAAEFARLCNTVGVDSKKDPDNAAKDLAKALSGPTVLEKGKVDRITNGKEVLIVDAEGGLKRCGGQGDILAGCLGTFAGWCKIYEENHPNLAQTSANADGGEVALDRLLLLAGYGASLTARECSRLAFKSKARAMLADDLLPVVGDAYEGLWGDVQEKAQL